MGEMGNISQFPSGILNRFINHIRFILRKVRPALFPANKNPICKKTPQEIVFRHNRF